MSAVCSTSRSRVRSILHRRWSFPNAPHPPDAPDEEASPRDEEEEDEEPVGDAEVSESVRILCSRNRAREPFLGAILGVMAYAESHRPPAGIPPPAQRRHRSGMVEAKDIAVCVPAKSENIPMRIRPHPRPPEEDHDEDAEPEGLPTVDGAGRHGAFVAEPAAPFRRRAASREIRGRRSMAVLAPAERRSRFRYDE